MTKDVVINVTGRQFDVGDVSVETAAEGNYYLKNGKHYVLYEERVEDSEDVIKNRVKFCDGYFEMVKNGAVSSALTFIPGQKTESLYKTTAGGVLMETDTHDVKIVLEDSSIHVKVNYTLHINGQFISKCEVDFKVRNR